MAKKAFEAEVNKLLKLIIHSLYSHNEIFLRELVSNAGDALDKMNLLSLSDDRFKNTGFTPSIDVSINEETRTLTISDNGVGMNEADLEENLGRIAHSGTAEFVTKLSDDAKKDNNLIGQFGVGFYSVFMVAKSVKVISKRAGEEKAFCWESDGESGYTIESAERADHGTDVICYLTEEHEEYASRYRVQEIIGKYSNHLAYPIRLRYTQKHKDKDGVETTEERDEQVNDAKALWKRSKSELTGEDYIEFYKTFDHASDEPLLYIHTNAEGSLEYTTLFYIPATAPFDLFQAGYRPGVKLYVKRVFITDDEKELLPPYLRFVHGIIDSQDLPLNVSREILQQNKVLSAIRNASVKRVLTEIKKLADTDREKFIVFVNQYNRLIKEGLYGDYANRDDLFEIVRFKSTAGDEWTSLADYKGRMPAEQKSIYYLHGETESAVKANPLLAAYKKKGFEVLLLNDDIDEFVIPMVGQYGELSFKAINLGDDEAFKDDKESAATEDVKELPARIKKALGDKISDARISRRLVDAPACLINSDDGMNSQMHKMMKAMGQNVPTSKPVLEINPDHSLVKTLAGLTDENVFAEYAALLLGGAYLSEGLLPENPGEFATLAFKFIN